MPTGSKEHATTLINDFRGSPQEYAVYEALVEAGVIDPGGYYTEERRAEQVAWWADVVRLAERGKKLFEGGREEAP